MRKLVVGLFCVLPLGASCSLDRAGTAAQPVGGSGGTVQSGGTGGTGGTGGSGGSGATATGGGPSGGTGGDPVGGTGATAGEAGSSGSAGQAGMGGTGGSPVFDPPWWDQEWKQRRPIEIENPAPEDLTTGFQIPLPVDPNTLPEASKPAWRIVRWNGSHWLELPRVIERVGDTTWVWFATEAPISSGATDDSYWLYAGKDGAVEPPFAASVFDFHEFFGTVQTANWATIGNVTFVGGEVRLDGSSSGASIRSTKTFAPGQALDFDMTVEQPLASNQSYFSGGFQRQDDFANQKPWLLWISRKTFNMTTEFYDDANYTWKGSTVALEQGVNHVYGIERFLSKHVFRYDHEVFDTATFGFEYTTAMQIRFSAYNGSVLRIHYVRVRKASDPPPIASLGEEETFDL